MSRHPRPAFGLVLAALILTPVSAFAQQGNAIANGKQLLGIQSQINGS